jgi:LPXTG-motif cell wall-anchored protein
MKKSKQLITLVLASLLFFISIKGTASEFNFAVNPVIPENQIDKTKTYFDLKMSPGSVQTVEVQLRNDTNEAVVIEPKIASATTNLNGVVEYGQNNIEPDETLKYNMKDLVEIAQTITIPKQSQVTLPVKIKMPSDPYTGVISGGLTLKEKTAETSDQSKDQGLAIKNEYAYVVAILLRQTTEEVAPDLKLLTVEPSQVNARNVINVTLQNPTATYLNSFRLINEVTKKGQTDSLYSSDTSSMQMAPNSHFSYPISLEGQKLEAGDYVLKSVAYSGKSEDGKYKVKNGTEEESYLYSWEFEMEFSVDGDVARKLNSKDVTIDQENLWLYLLLGMILLIVAFLIIWYRRRKKKNETD